MGEYFYIANKTKRQFLHPHKLGEGLKLFELGSNCMHAMAWLLCGYSDSGSKGSWAGDSVIIVGDYDDRSEPTQKQIEADYTDITHRIVEELCRERRWFAASLAGNGWYMGMSEHDETMPPSLLRLLREVRSGEEARS